jgi:benzoyl-CoA 2,3-dioxygenase component B
VRRSGDPDSPRILGAFNEPCTDWLNFFCFTTFTDRDGKYQLRALAESGFDPLARTATFMLTEEAHHMFVGQTGVGRVLKRTAERMKEGDPRTLGVIPVDMVQRHINLWFALSLDLFGGEDSSNAATFFGAGIKGRDQETRRYDEHTGLDQYYRLTRSDKDGKLSTDDVPLRRAMNEVLRDAYVEDCEKVVKGWNRLLEKEGCDLRVRLPHRRFYRHQGIYAGIDFDVDGHYLTPEKWAARKHEWLPNDSDRDYINSLMRPVMEPGEFADWISPPPRGINGNPIDFSYVRFNR